MPASATGRPRRATRRVLPESGHGGSGHEDHYRLSVLRPATAQLRCVQGHGTHGAQAVVSDRPTSEPACPTRQPYARVKWPPVRRRPGEHATDEQIEDYLE